MCPAPPSAAPDRSADVLACDKQPELRKLRRRAEFLVAARARRQGGRTLLLQGRDRRDGDSAIGMGFTCSRKLGNAVARNRAKRRLRAVAREVLPRQGLPGWDYVLIGKPGATVDCPFEALRADLDRALRRMHAPTGGAGADQ